ncbi:hypothetical protein [Xenorhabdus sp. NBAII XenSa04]
MLALVLLLNGAVIVAVGDQHRGNIAKQAKNAHRRFKFADVG